MPALLGMFRARRFLLIFFVVIAKCDFSPRLSYSSLLLEYATRSQNFSSTLCTETPIIEIETVGNLTAAEENPSIGNCTNNLTNPSSITHVPPKPPSHEQLEVAPSEEAAPKQPIVTFDEWTKEKLKQEQRKAASPATFATPTPSNPSGRNYASKECGAKVLMSNPEAENTKAVLNDKEQDEYMRNPCNKAESKFVVVELCETIQPRHVVIGNLELFSSGPKDFRVWVAERSGADWQLLGNFTAADSRQQQTFQVTTRVYAKLVKLELLSHYGNEHYCTLSVMKVLGISMVDEYEIEAEAAVRRPVLIDPVTVPPQTVPVETTTTDPSKSVEFTSAPVESTVTAPPSDSKPIVRDIVDQVVSGSILQTIVTAVTDKLKGDSAEQKTTMKYKPFDMSLCQVCPVNPSCIVPTHLCWVFVWRPPPRNFTALMTPFALPTHRFLSERRRRRRIAFHQRRMALSQKKKAATDVPPIPPNPVPVAEESSTEPVVSATEPPVADLVSPTTPVLHSAADAIPASSISHKESVFMKLNKRIAALELNMSLSSEYLSELSRQYVAQTDEHKKHLEQARKAALDVADEVENRLNNAISERMSSMRKEMDSLSKFLNSMRVAASEPSLARFWQSRESRDSCRSEDVTHLKRYVDNADLDQDGLWTTEQVLYVVMAAQLLTATVFSLMMCFNWMRRASSVEKEELEKMIREKVKDALKANEAAVQPPPIVLNPPDRSNNKKIRRRRNRRPESAGANYPSSDSAVSRTTSCQTETSSEAESARAAEALLDVTLRASPPPKSEEEEPWIPVKRKTSSHSRA